MTGDEHAFTDSLATDQRSLVDPDVTHPLSPPLTTGCPETSTDEVPVPLELGFDYDALDPGLFEGPLADGVDRWSPLLPPLVEGGGLGEGNTPLVRAPALADDLSVGPGVYVKDESRNPTWSHKDRLNRVAVSAAAREGATGVVVSSSGNHGAAAAAYAARLDVPCVVLTSPSTPGAVVEFLSRYGAAVLAVEGWEARARAVDRLAADHGYHPVSSRTAIHTGHPYGPEGYKTIAYETALSLGEAPGTVFVPTGFAELLYGVWKGFRELAALGVTRDAPWMVACEPAARAPLASALASDRTVAEVPPEPTAADAIKVTRNSHRGVRAVEESGGTAVAVPDDALTAAQDRLARTGLWQEVSGAAGVAGFRQAVAGECDVPVEEPVVCVATSSGFKDGSTASAREAGPGWSSVRSALREEYDLAL